MPERIFMKLCMYIKAFEPISTAYFINPSHQSVSVCIVARQRLSKHVTAATNTHATVEVLLDALSSMWSESYQMKVADQFFPELLVLYLNFNNNVNPTKQEINKKPVTYKIKIRTKCIHLTHILTSHTYTISLLSYFENIE
jgi:hypothetical protein